MASKRVITLKGDPFVNEEGSASAAITPGYLLKGVTSLAVFDNAGGPAARQVALERDELGKDIDAAYASGDTVKVGVFSPGMRALLWIASGHDIDADTFLEPDGSGRVRALASGTVLARALETVDNSAGLVDARIRCEFV